MKLKLTKLTLALMAIITGLLILIGCGGSSSSGGASSVDLFITDDMSADYSGVWVTLYKAEIYNTAGASTTLFESTEGLPVNLRQLNDGASRFLLLAPGRLPDGTYNKVQFNVGKTVNLVAAVGGAPSTATFPNSLDNGTGRSKLEVNLTPAVTIPGTPRLAIDFDLKNWTVTGGVITPVVGVHPGGGLTDPTRHERFEFKGLVSNLVGTAPDQTFNLQLRFGGNVTVQTSIDTSFVGDGSAVFGNGAKAEVFGEFNPLTRVVTARVVRFESEFENEAKAIGKASNIAAVAGTFDVLPKFTRGFVPQGEKVSVVTNGTTRYRGRRGVTLTQAEFFTALTNAGTDAVVEVEGAYSSTNNTLTAKSVHIENEVELGGVEAQGTASAPDVEVGSFSLTISESEGFTPPNATMTVKVSSITTYKSATGASMTKAGFFEALRASGTVVKVHGVIRDGAIAAGRCEIKQSGGGGNNQ